MELLEDRRPLVVDAQLVADLNPTFNSAGSSPSSIVDVGGVAFFLAPDGHQASALTLAVNDAASDDSYDAVAEQAVSVITADNDSAMDTDSDNLNDAVEDAHPNNGDGNGDGVLGGQQSNVASLPSVKSGTYVTLAVPEGIILADVSNGVEPALLPALSGIGFPLGFLDHQLAGLTPGGATTVTVYLEDGVGINALYKFGPTPDEPTPHWYRFTFDGRTGAKFFADRIVLHYIDGQRGDDDLAANGVIHGAGGPAADARTYPWQNPFFRWDVNDDRRIDPLDVLVMFNRLNRAGSPNLPEPVGGTNVVRDFVDVYPDHTLTAQDALSVINEINARGVRKLGETESAELLAGEGESSGAIPWIPAGDSLTPSVTTPGPALAASQVTRPPTIGNSRLAPALEPSGSVTEGVAATWAEAVDDCLAEDDDTLAELGSGPTWSVWGSFLGL
jgi:hypothetical protein